VVRHFFFLLQPRRELSFGRIVTNRRFNVARLSCPHREWHVDRNLHEVSGQSRHPVASTLCESLLDDEVLALDVASICEASSENIEMGPPRAGAAGLQPAGVRYPGSLLRLRGRYGEQA
jgi:hypothetical protein